jgi:lipopolysaccharide export system protein LptC
VTGNAYDPRRLKQQEHFTAEQQEHFTAEQQEHFTAEQQEHFTTEDAEDAEDCNNLGTTPHEH